MVPMLPSVMKAGMMQMLSWLAIFLDLVNLFTVSWVHVDRLLCFMKHVSDWLCAIYCLGGIAVGGLATTAPIGIENVVCPSNVTSVSQCGADSPPVTSRCFGSFSAAGVRCVQGVCHLCMVSKNMHNYVNDCRMHVKILTLWVFSYNVVGEYTTVTHNKHPTKEHPYTIKMYIVSRV